VAVRQIQVMLIGAGCAGLAGAIQILGVAHFMTAKMGNYGYAGIAVALLGRLDPIGVAVAAIFFGALDAGAQRAEESSIGLPHETANIVKAIVILAMLIIGAWSMRRTLRGGLLQPDVDEERQPA
jgi:simple sugar transport system permease protein